MRSRCHVRQGAVDASTRWGVLVHHQSDGLTNLHHLTCALRRRRTHQTQRHVGPNRPDHHIRTMGGVGVHDGVNTGPHRMVFQELKEGQKLIDLAGIGS